MPSYVDSATVERIAALIRQTGTDPALVAEALNLPEGCTFDSLLDRQQALSPSDVLAIAEVIKVPATVLTGQVAPNKSLAACLRLGLAETAEAPAAALRYAQMLLQHLAILDTWTSPVRGPLSKLPVSRDPHFVTAGKKTAARVRDMLGIGDGPITDLVELVESTGVPVSFQSLPEHVHGINVKDDLPTRSLRAIVVRADDWWTRQRYTLAHEFCHDLYNDAGQVIIDQVDVPETQPEWRAESFARHLLLPESALRREVNASQRSHERVETLIARVVMTYGVSRDVILRALVNDRPDAGLDLRAVHEQSVGQTMTLGGFGDEWSEMCEGQHEPSGSPWLVERAVEAYGEGWVGAGFVAELLDESEQVTRQILAEAGWGSQPS